MSLIKYLVAPLFELIVRVRAALYRRGILASRRLVNPVISIGNLTVGGTGKTPFVAYLAQLLKEAGFQPIILSRGYRGKAEHSLLLVSDGDQICCRPEDCGDEPYWLAKTLPGVPVVVGKNRFQAGRSVEDRYEKVIHLLDDGYQHLQLRRNLNLLLIDGTDPFGGNSLLPAGRLREPLRAIGRADLVIVTRAHHPLDLDNIEVKIRDWNPVVPISYFYHDAVDIFDLKSKESFPLRRFANHKFVALAAIGNPKAFLDDLAHYQLRVVDEFLFRDHHVFSQEELNQALDSCRREGAQGVITTEKDGIRLTNLSFEQGQILVFRIQAHPEDADAYRRFILGELEQLPEPH